ncbi:MAG TPA: GTPase HflX, partial [Stellaceae bacterium]|nr:GTPase HflX [Stellaceae bacterium]
MTAAQDERIPSTGRCLVLHPVLKLAPSETRDETRSPEGRLDEAVGLAAAINLHVMHADVVRVSRWRPATLIGSGAVEAFAKIIAEQEITVAV